MKKSCPAHSQGERILKVTWLKNLNDPQSGAHGSIPYWVAKGLGAGVNPASYAPLQKMGLTGHEHHAARPLSEPRSYSLWARGSQNGVGVVPEKKCARRSGLLRLPEPGALILDGLNCPPKKCKCEDTAFFANTL